MWPPDQLVTGTVATLIAMAIGAVVTIVSRCVSRVIRRRKAMTRWLYGKKHSQMAEQLNFGPGAGWKASENFDLYYKYLFDTIDDPYLYNE